MGPYKKSIWCILILLALRQFYVIDVHIIKCFLEKYYPEYSDNNAPNESW